MSVPGIIPGTVPGITRDSFPRGMDRNGMEGRNAGSHSSSGRSRSSKAADPLTVASCRPMNEQRR